MNDISPILVASFQEALKQINTYMAISATTAVSVFLLEFRIGQYAERQTVSLGEGFIPLSQDAAKWLALGICLAMGLLAQFSSEAASIASKQLEMEPLTLKAACLFPSVVTASWKFRLLFLTFPVALTLPTILRFFIRLREEDPSNNWFLIAIWLYLVYSPYLLLAIATFELPCHK